MSYTFTAADVERVFGQDDAEVRAHFERLAAEQRPEVERAIASLTGTDSGKG